MKTVEIKYVIDQLLGLESIISDNLELGTGTGTDDGVSSLYISNQKYIDFWKRRIEKENLQVFTYKVISSNIVVYERNQNRMDEEFIQILIDRMVMQHYFKDVKSLRYELVETLLQPESIVLDVEYETRFETGITKKILGYDCFKLVVNVSGAYNDTTRYSGVFNMFVTNEINLPADIVLSFKKKVSNYCPLEIEYIIKDRNYKVYQNAISVEIYNSNKDDAIPEKYKDVKKLDL